MLNISRFISENVTFRQRSMFLADIENNSETIRREVEGKSLCVIGGAGSIGTGANGQSGADGICIIQYYI